MTVTVRYLNLYLSVYLPCLSASAWHVHDSTHIHMDLSHSFWIHRELIPVHSRVGNVNIQDEGTRIRLTGNSLYNIIWNSERRK